MMDILGSADFSLVGKARLEPVLLYKDGLRALLTHILQFLARANTNDTRQCPVTSAPYILACLVTSIKMPIWGTLIQKNSIQLNVCTQSKILYVYRRPL